MAVRSNVFLRFTRLIHLYLGVFTAPALLFFAFSGALQTFSLHQTTPGSSYKPAAWIVTLGQIHKKQTPVLLAKKGPQPAVAHAGDSTEKKPVVDAAEPSAPLPAAQKHHPLPMKIFFLVVSLGLFLSAISGIYMSYKYMRNRNLVTALLVLGIVIPIALAFV